MLIYMDNKIISSKDKPLVIFLQPQDKINISKMLTSANVYCEFEKEKHSIEFIEALLKNAKAMAKEHKDRDNG